MNQKNFSISEIHWSHIFNEFLMSVTPRREENAVFLETGSNSVMLFSIALCAFRTFVLLRVQTTITILVISVMRSR